jgi:hypothetical protein
MPNAPERLAWHINPVAIEEFSLQNKLRFSEQKRRLQASLHGFFASKVASPAHLAERLFQEAPKPLS